jgi:ferric-dicitrate binding protein FerR (iron transport regulator)
MAVSEEQQIQLMAYLDGEMDARQRSEFERVLLDNPPLQQQLAQFQRLQGLVQQVRIPEPKLDLWDEYPRRGGEKAFRLLGWLLFLAGVLIVALGSEYLLWRSDEIPWILKAGITLMIAGLAVLLGSVLSRRGHESKTDRYKEILR